MDASPEVSVKTLDTAAKLKFVTVTGISIFTLFAMERSPDALSKITLSAAVGNVPAVAPPEVFDQWIVCDQFPEPPIQ